MFDKCECLIYDERVFMETCVYMTTLVCLQDSVQFAHQHNVAGN